MVLLSNSDLPHRYFACVRRRDLDALSAFFASDATLLLPDGRELNGVEPIRAMYAHLFATQAPCPTVQQVIAGSEALAVEYEVCLPSAAARQLAGFFHLNSDGRIARLHLYARR